MLIRLLPGYRYPTVQAASHLVILTLLLGDFPGSRFLDNSWSRSQSGQHDLKKGVRYALTLLMLFDERQPDTLKVATEEVQEGLDESQIHLATFLAELILEQKRLTDHETVENNWETDMVVDSDSPVDN